jgi:hypothetical protein
LLVAALLAACGEKDEPDATSAAPTASAPDKQAGPGWQNGGADRKQFVGRSGTATKTACELVPVAKVEAIVADAAGERRVALEPTSNNSLDLSFCEYRDRGGPDTYVKLTLDTAVRAVRRYYNLIVEARQLPSIGTGGEEDSYPVLVRNVGDDGTYGGAGAYWTPSQLDLISIKDERIVKVHFYVDGVSQVRARKASAELAKRAFAGYDD